MSKDSDQKSLIGYARAFRDGDETALSPIIDLTQNKLYRFLVYFTGNSTLAEEIAQETYLVAFRKIRKLKEPEKFQSWLFTIARNLALRSLKKENAFDKNQDTEGSSDPSQTAQIVQVQQILGKMSQKDREVLLLTDLEGHSYQEAAGILGISENALRSRLHRARKEFGSLWEKEA